MSMFKKLKSVFIVEDESAEETNSGTSTAKPAPSVSSGSSNMSSVKPTADKDNIGKTGSGTKPDNKFIDLLLKAIESNNMDGFDYLEFKQSLQSLSKIEPDEAKRFQSAYAMAQTMGLDKKKLFDSAQHYSNVLADEERKFADAFQKQKTAQVVEREQKVEILKKSIISKEEQIKQLQAEIINAKDELNNIEGMINESLAKVEATKDGFYASYNMVMNQITSDVERIKQYIN